MNSMEINENRWKSMEPNGNRWKLLQILTIYDVFRWNAMEAGSISTGLPLETDGSQQIPNGFPMGMEAGSIPTGSIGNYFSEIVELLKEKLINGYWLLLRFLSLSLLLYSLKCLKYQSFINSLKK